MIDIGKVFWVIQTNRLGWMGTHDIYKLTAFLEAQGTPFGEVELQPEGELPKVVHEGPVLFYGAARYIERVRASSWKPGVFYDPKTFAFEAQKKGYGEDFLNADSWTLPFVQLAAKLPKVPLFVRPVGALNEFVGKVRGLPELGEILKTARDYHPEMMVVAAPVKLIECEWRLVLVEGRVVTGSMYRLRGEAVGGVVPKDVAAFAEEMAQQYSPSPVHVLDVCEVEGKRRVVEANCFNCSGWYGADFRVIARAVTEAAVKLYGEAG